MYSNPCQQLILWNAGSVAIGFSVEYATDFAALVHSANHPLCGIGSKKILSEFGTVVVFLLCVASLCMQAWDLQNSAKLIFYDAWHPLLPHEQASLLSHALAQLMCVREEAEKKRTKFWSRFFALTHGIVSLLWVASNPRSHGIAFRAHSGWSNYFSLHL